MPVQAAANPAAATDDGGTRTPAAAQTAPTKRKRNDEAEPQAQAVAAAAAPASKRSAAAAAASASPKQSGDEEDSSSQDTSSSEPRSHPYGVQPWGNFYLTQVPEIRTAGVLSVAGLLSWCPGALHPPNSHPLSLLLLLCCCRMPSPHTGLGVLSALSDELMLAVLELLPAPDLTRLGLASKALYCFAHTADLWKGLVLQVRCFS